VKKFSDNAIEQYSAVSCMLHSCWCSLFSSLYDGKANSCTWGGYFCLCLVLA